MLDHKLTIFYHLGKNPNTTKVAEALYLSQPAISKSIKELEKELGITLFDRTKGRLQLTFAGMYLLKETEELIRKERSILFEIDKMKNIFGGTLNIGASTTLAQYVLPEILAGFTQGENRPHIHLISGNTRQIEDEIVANNLHLAFIEGTPTQPEIHYIPFIRDEIVLVSSGNTATRESISKDELKNLNFVFREKGSGTYDVIKKHIKDAGIDINGLHDQLILGSTEGIKQYLLHSNCFALLSIYSIRNEVASGKLKITEIEGLSIDRMFYVIHKQGQVDPYAKKFLDYATYNRK